MSVRVPDTVISHWSTLLEGVQTSPLAFYQAVEAALEKRQIPNAKNSRVDHKEGGVLSANREYLRVMREKLLFDVCGAPFGTGFFVSWWFAEEAPKLNPLVKAAAVVAFFVVAALMLGQFGFVLGPLVFALLLFGGLAVANTMANNGEFNENIIRELPILGTLYTWLFKPVTYYRIDSIEMFQQAVHNAVLEVIDAMTTEKGIRALTESERKPIMREYYSHKGA